MPCHGCCNIASTTTRIIAYLFIVGYITVVLATIDSLVRLIPRNAEPKNIYYIFKGTSKIHLNFKVGILYGLLFLAIVAAMNFNYAPNFEKVDGAYCFWSVRGWVGVSHFLYLL